MAGWEYGNSGWRLGRLKGEYAATRITDGRRQRHRLGVTCRSGNEKAGKRALAEFVESLNQLSQPTRPVAAIEDVYERYKEDRERDGKDTERMAHSWKALDPHFGAQTLDTVNAEMCRRYAEHRTRAGRARDTIWTELTHLRAAVKWYCAEHRIIPPRLWVPQKGPGRSRVITKGEARKLLQAATTPHVRLFINLCIATGARTGAILDLTWDNVDFDAGVIDLKGVDTTKSILDKSYRKGRAVVIMNGLARAALTPHYEVRTCKHVIEWAGRPVKSVKKAVRRAADEAGLVGVSAHTLRHSTATWLENDGEDMQTIARFLGHKRVSTTQEIYAHPDAEVTRSAAERVNLRVIGG